MNKPFKFNDEKRPDFRFERSNHRAHYEDLAASILPSIVRHRRLVASLVAVAAVFACVVIPLMPRRYSAEALVYPSLLSREQGKVVPVASVDATTMVAGEARLIRSDAILRKVAKRLGQDPSPPGPRWWPTLPFDWLQAALLPETRNHSPFDRMVAMLRNQVVVMNDTRSYLISVSFTASSAEHAAQVVNTVVTEYLRDKVKQRWLEKIISAETELRQQQALYGEKHPKTLQAVADLDAERASLEAAMNSRDGDQYEVANDQSVKLAAPNYTPTSPKGFVIFGLSLLSALLIGIGLAIWRDRKQAEIKQDVGCQPHRKKSERRYTVNYPPHSR